MGRPIKTGLDYFPLDTRMDEKFELLEAKYGMKGFGLIIKLFQKAYSEHGYFYPWREREQLLFCKWVSVDINEVNAVIEYAVSCGIFDEELFRKGVLTSSGIQKRYLEATKRRTDISMHEDLLLVSVDITGVNAGNNARNVAITRYFDENSTQIKGNRNRNRNDKKDSAPALPSPSVSRDRFQKPTLADVQAFITENQLSVNADTFIDYYESNGWLVGKVKMKNWRATVKNWHRRGEGRTNAAEPKPAPKRKEYKYVFIKDEVCPFCGKTLYKGDPCCRSCYADQNVGLPDSLYERVEVAS